MLWNCRSFFFFLLFQQIAWWPFLIKSYESIQKLQPSTCSAQNNVLSNTVYYWNSNFLTAVIWVGSQLPHTTSLPWQQVWYPLGEQTRRLEERPSAILILAVSLRANILHLKNALDLHESYTCLFMHVYFLHREYCVPWNKTQALRIYWEYICSSAMED